MAISGLNGPYALTDESIERVVTKKSPGVYALGRFEDNVFHIAYVGRSDTDINGSLKKHVGDYSHFKFDYFLLPKLAFEKECELYHDFGEDGLDSGVHPTRRSQDVTWRCPRCKDFG